MDWKKTLKKTLWVAAFAAAYAVLDYAVPLIRESEAAWAAILIPALVALRDWLNHRGG